MRSIRVTVSPQLWAMSVALEAQGETVPKRGVTKSNKPDGVVFAGSP